MPPSLYVSPTQMKIIASALNAFALASICFFVFYGSISRSSMGLYFLLILNVAMI